MNKKIQNWRARACYDYHVRYFDASCAAPLLLAQRRIGTGLRLALSEVWDSVCHDWTRRGAYHLQTDLTGADISRCVNKKSYMV